MCRISIPKPELQIKFNPQERRHLCVWKDDRISGYRKFARADVLNIGEKIAKDCIATLEVIEGPSGFEKYYLEPRKLHWIDTIERQVVPVNIQKGHYHTLDVIFSQPKKVGAYIASTWSVSRTLYPQDRLIPGDYIVKIEVQGENAEPVFACFKVISRTSYKDLYVDIVPCPSAKT